MVSFKDPSFQHRAGQAADAKKKSLEQLRLRPLPDERIVAERKAAEARRQAAKTDKAEAAAKAAAPVATETERKAARDARYAARKNRK